MECQAYNRNVATVHVTDLAKGQTRVRHLCEECADRELERVRAPVGPRFYLLMPAPTDPTAAINVRCPKCHAASVAAPDFQCQKCGATAKRDVVDRQGGKRVRFTFDSSKDAGKA